MRWLPIVTLTGLVGCGRFSFEPQSGGDDVQGNGDGGNTSGDGGSSGDGGGNGDAAIDAPTVISPNCGTTILINDDFSDGTMGAQWTMVTSAGYTVTEASGNVSVAFPATAAANTRAGYRQSASVAFANTCAIAELVTVPATAAQAFAYIRLGTPTLNVEAYVFNGTLSARFTNGGTTGTIGGGTAFSAVNHRFLRIRNTGGNNYTFEAGPSLTNFGTLIGSQGGILLGVSPSSLEFGGSTTMSMASGAGTAAFASVTFLAP